MEEDTALSWMYDAIRGASRVELKPVTNVAPDAGEAAFPHETAHGLRLPALPGEEVGWPSMLNRKVLMVRHFYDRFIEQHIWCVLPEVKGAAARPENLRVITGTPGIGKSAFGMYLLHRALKARKTVVLIHNVQSRAVPQITVFHDDMVWDAISIRDIKNLLRNPNVVFLYDGVEPLTLGYNTILITSPDESLWSKFMKVDGTELLQFPVYSLHELLQLQQLMQ
ncbi:MAG: hypothetical protein EOO65_05315 [Methanosarcinales archaeon]|nr:MAG: hypothetical protein EOO65_05315 [Methanosarcinales archaeon]